MPKALDNARKLLIDCGRKMVAKDGYSQFSMRDVARQCGMAPGTVYNYFHSKDDLIAACMLEDWTAVREDMKKAVSKAKTAKGALKAVYEAICGYCAENSSVIKDSQACANFHTHAKEYHSVVYEAVLEALAPVCEKAAVSYSEEFAPFISENLIRYSVREYSFNVFYNLITPLFKAEK